MCYADMNGNEVFKTFLKQIILKRTYNISKQDILETFVLLNREKFFYDTLLARNVCDKYYTYMQ